MLCQACQTPAKRHGTDRKGIQRYRCRTCRKTFSERSERPIPEMYLPTDKMHLILKLLCEGSAVRSIERTTGVDKSTILKLLVLAGERCEKLLAEKIQGVQASDIQADEVWSYIHCKQGTRARKGITDPDAGDAYCYIGMDRKSKLVLSWHLGRRNAWDCHDFIVKLAAATDGQCQISTDAFNAYPNAIEYAFGARANYAQVIKEFANAGGEEGRRYAPPRLISQQRVAVQGTPDEERACTSHVERGNWTLRGHLRRFTRLSNGFSRKKKNLRAALALYFAYYNFVRFHKSIRMTPAMAAGVAKKPWTVADLLAA